MRTSLLFAALLTLPITGEIIDRVAVAVEHQVITETQIDEELAVTAFLNRKPIPRDLDARRDAADRLVEQVLIAQDIQFSRYPPPAASDIEAYVKQVESQFGTPSTLVQALREYGISEETLKEHLISQLKTLHFVEFRFRSGSSVTDADVQAYYQREVGEAQSHHAPAPPPLSESRESLRQVLIEQRTDEALNAWLEEARKRFSIIYLDKSLR